MNTNRTTRTTASKMGKESQTLLSSNQNKSERGSKDDLHKSTDQPLSIDDLFDRMKLMIEEGNVKIEQKIDGFNSTLVNEITTLRTDVKALKADCVQQFRDLKDSFTVTQRDVNENREAIRRQEKSRDLLLTGVPYTVSESTDEFLHKVALAVGYTDENVPLVFTKRLARTPIAPGTTPPILMQFAFKASRDEFFHRYLSTRNLNLLALGFSVDRRIFLNENLTDSARRAKGAAIKLKKEGKISSVFTKDGVIFVKSKPDSPAQPVNSPDQLQSFG